MLAGRRRLEVPRPVGVNQRVRRLARRGINLDTPRMDPDPLPPPPTKPPPAWRVATAPRIFGHAVIALCAVVGQQIVVQQLVTSRGLDANADGLWVTTTLIVMVAAVVGGWIGFVYAHRSTSDRGLILLSCWGLSTALGLAVLFAALPESPTRRLDPLLRPAMHGTRPRELTRPDRQDTPPLP